MPNGVYTTAEQRPNAYIPEAEATLPLPKPYGALAPFKPSEPGANMRHIRKPIIKPIEIWVGEQIQASQGEDFNQASLYPQVKNVSIILPILLISKVTTISQQQSTTWFLFTYQLLYLSWHWIGHRTVLHLYVKVYIWIAYIFFFTLYVEYIPEICSWQGAIKMH